MHAVLCGDMPEWWVCMVHSVKVKSTAVNTATVVSFTATTSAQDL